jgi:hypothetical protein
MFPEYRVANDCAGFSTLQSLRGIASGTAVAVICCYFRCYEQQLLDPQKSSSNAPLVVNTEPC